MNGVNIKVEKAKPNGRLFFAPLIPLSILL